MQLMYSPFTALKNLDKLAVIWLNGSLKSAPTSWIRVWNGAKLKYCTDGAANFLMSLCEEKTIESPHMIAGDFDSILPKVRSYFDGKAKIVNIADQDSTDLTKTLQLICQDPLIGPDDKILLLGGFHGRFDHTLGAMNAIVLHQKASNLPVFAIDDENVITVLREGCTQIVIDKTKITGICGLLPLCQRETKVTTQGFCWNLSDQCMEYGGIVSNCNKIENEQLEVCTSAPTVFTFQLKDPNNF